MGEEYNRALDAQIADKKRREMEEKMQDKADILAQYRDNKMGGQPGSALGGKSTGDLNHLIQRQQHLLNVERENFRGNTPPPQVQVSSANPVTAAIQANRQRAQEQQQLHRAPQDDRHQGGLFGPPGGAGGPSAADRQTESVRDKRLRERQEQRRGNLHGAPVAAAAPPQPADLFASQAPPAGPEPFAQVIIIRSRLSCIRVV
jgi:hypothetical protein